ncbi:chemotaxis protein [Acetobacter oeni LMG 21952]|nr:chemotaxis protein [Acetobacter oeni LMG 21952]
MTLVVQGDVLVSDNPTAIFMTLLGSCVSACMYDSAANVGGMNHFLLPAGNGYGSADRISYGTHAMEKLINSLLNMGAKKSRLKCKLFGGANIRPQFGNIGTQNSEFATEFLSAEGITCTSSSTGGVLGRRVRFWPVGGRAQQALIRDETMPATEIKAAQDDILRIRMDRQHEVDFF